MDRDKIKLKKVVREPYFDENMKLKTIDIYVQITQDNRGTTISLDDLTISLTHLGYRLVKDR